MRVLHLLDPAHCADEGLLACAAAMRSIPAAQHHAWIVGSEADEQRCWALGILTTDRVPARRSIVPGCDPDIIGLGRLRAARERAGSPAPDLVQCWSLDGLHLARAIFGLGPGAPARCAVVARPPRAPQRSLPPDSDLATGREVLIAYDHPTRHALAPLLSRDGGSHADRWLPAIRSIAAPAFEPGGPITIDRAALRDSLGLKPGEIAIALLADPPSRADAHRISFALGVLRAVGHRTVLLLRRGATLERRAAAYVAAHSRRWGLTIADLSLPQLAIAADLAIIDDAPSPNGSTTPSCGPVAASLALCMALPIVTFPGVLPGWPVLAAPSSALGRLAVPISSYLENPQIRIDFAASARSFCDRTRAASSFQHTLAAIWREQLNVPSSDVAPTLVR